MIQEGEKERKPKKREDRSSYLHYLLEGPVPLLPPGHRPRLVDVLHEARLPVVGDVGRGALFRRGRLGRLLFRENSFVFRENCLFRQNCLFRENSCLFRENLDGPCEVSAALLAHVAAGRGLDGLLRLLC